MRTFIDDVVQASKILANFYNYQNTFYHLNTKSERLIIIQINFSLVMIFPELL